MSTSLSKHRDAEALSAVTFDSVYDWLLDEAWRLPDLTSFMNGLCQYIEADGLPLLRASVTVGTLHPQISGYYIVKWGGEDATESNGPHGLQDMSFVTYGGQGCAHVRRSMINCSITRDSEILSTTDAHRDALWFT